MKSKWECLRIIYHSPIFRFWVKLLSAFAVVQVYTDPDFLQHQLRITKVNMGLMFKHLNVIFNVNSTSQSQVYTTLFTHKATLNIKYFKADFAFSCRFCHAYVIQNIPINPKSLLFVHQTRLFNQVSILIIKKIWPFLKKVFINRIMFC